MLVVGRETEMNSWNLLLRDKFTTLSRKEGKVLLW